MIIARTCLNANDDDSKFVHLVPELCYLVGMTDQMRNRRHIWREIASTLRVDAPIKINRMKILIENIFKKSKPLLQSWGVNLSKAPVKHIGYKLDPGNIVCGPKDEILQESNLG
jgi:aubergine-like protein